MSELKSKGGATIEKGDTVSTPYRGGKHEGEVEQIITSEKQAKQLENAKGAGHAPAVVFTDQNNKKVAHKPNTVTNLDKEG
ncbi:hypothetical protein G647_09724 [Cladophialophora carrionii CBS 160.54]|uniref:Hypervirulence associated protein TUDOR domain-containing protein n=1 Tax=Cladophialophora carrionii CBS 160.54 TaxID=1279043 RepID=V9DMI6_9EURO|nr:uncharacterized protein G647_09724 [Cladophialophora carrionii CBS 160.54]ETI27533.1 hypothetical protein G647_09724 [Cladophialophora carrionii CBS 160.54]